MNLVALASSQVSVLQLPARATAPDGEDVVMIHGLAANLAFWYAGAAQWFTHFGRVTLYDLPGHGRSEMRPSGYTPSQLAKDLGELLDCLRLDRVHLVAHSFGGMVALCFALQQPERVKSMVLADVRLWPLEPPSRAGAPPAWLKRMRDVGLLRDQAERDPSVQVLVELARLQLTRPERATAAFAALTGGRALFGGRRAAQRWLDLMDNTKAYSEMTSGGDFEIRELETLRQPMLALFGGHSLLQRSARALEQLCPNCRLEIVPNVGHFFPLTRPRIFAALALDFLANTRASQVGRGGMRANWAINNMIAPSLGAPGDDDDEPHGNAALAPL
jgi:pimeloyl-ACP methyl ester carboxylesterase